MRTIYSIIVLMLITLNLWSQVPQQFSYQAVLRDDKGRILDDKKVSVRISMLKGKENGDLVYQEYHHTITNVNGLITLQIGRGDEISGDFSKIDWSSGPFYLKTEVSTTGSNKYDLYGTSQLLSVPYALYAANSQPGSKGAKGDQGDGLINGTKNNQLLYWNGSNWVILNPGTHGQTLTWCDAGLIWTSDGNCSSTTPPTTGN